MFLPVCVSTAAKLGALSAAEQPFTEPRLELEMELELLEKLLDLTPWDWKEGAGLDGREKVDWGLGLMD